MKQIKETQGTKYEGNYHYKLIMHKGSKTMNYELWTTNYELWTEIRCKQNVVIINANQVFKPSTKYAPDDNRTKSRAIIERLEHRIRRRKRDVDRRLESSEGRSVFAYQVGYEVFAWGMNSSSDLCWIFNHQSWINLTEKNNKSHRIFQPESKDNVKQC